MLDARQTWGSAPLDLSPATLIVPRVVDRSAVRLVSAGPDAPVVTIPRPRRLPNGLTDEQIAQRVLQNQGNAQNLLRLFLGMPLPQRQSVARIMGFHSVDEMSQRFVDGSGGLFTNPVHATLLRDVLRRTNETGSISREAIIHAELTNPRHGVAASTQILMDATPAEQDRISRTLLAEHRVNLDQLIAGVPSGDARTNLTFVRNPANRDRRTGLLAPGTVNALRFRLSQQEHDQGFVRDIWEAWTGQRTGSFASLLEMTPAEAARAVTAYNQMPPAQILAMPDPRHDFSTAPVENDPGFFFRNFRAEAALLTRERLRVAARGLAGHTENRAEYVALTMLQAQRGGVPTQDLEDALAMIRANYRPNERPRPGDNPTMDDVMAAYRTRSLQLDGQSRETSWRQLEESDREPWRQQALRAAAEKLGRDPAELTPLFRGQGPDTPESRNRAIDRALRGFTGVDSAALHRALDLSNVPEADRPHYMQVLSQRRDEIIRATGGPTMRLGDGREVPSQAAAYLDSGGVLSAARQMMYAIHTRGFLGTGRAQAIADVVRMASTMTPLDKIILRETYRQVARGDLMTDLRALGGWNGAYAESLMRVGPQDYNAAMAQLAAILRPTTELPPGVSAAQVRAAQEAFLGAHFRFAANRREFRQRFVGETPDDTLRRMREFIEPHIDRSEVVSESLDRMQREVAGNWLMEMVANDALGSALRQNIRNLSPPTPPGGWTAENLRNVQIDEAELRRLTQAVLARMRDQGQRIDRISEQTVRTSIMVAAFGAVVLTKGAATPFVAAGATTATGLLARFATGRMSDYDALSFAGDFAYGLGAGIVAMPSGMWMLPIKNGVGYATMNLAGNTQDLDPRNAAQFWGTLGRRTLNDGLTGAGATLAMIGLYRAFHPRAFEQARPPQQTGGPNRTGWQDRPVHPTRPGVRPDPVPARPITPRPRPSAGTHTQTGPGRLPNGRPSGNGPITVAKPARVPTGGGPINPDRGRPVTVNPGRGDPVHTSTGTLPKGGRTGTAH